MRLQAVYDHAHTRLVPLPADVLALLKVPAAPSPAPAPAPALPHVPVQKGIGSGNVRQLQELLEAAAGGPPAPDAARNGEKKRGREAKGKDKEKGKGKGKQHKGKGDEDEEEDNSEEEDKDAK